MIFLRKNWQNKASLLLLGFTFVSSACSSAPTILQSTYEVSSCREEPSVGKVTRKLMEKGYYHYVDRKGAYDIFHKPRIEKAGMLASEPFVDKSGDFGVAVCSPAGVLAVAEVRSCERIRDCTSDDQKQVGEALEKLGCKVKANTRRTRSWQLESRKDWTTDSCRKIVSELEIKQ